MTAEMPPPLEPVQHRDSRPRSGDVVAVVALVAFIFGVALNGYIALSILDGGESSASSSSSDEPIIVPAAPTVEPTPTETPLPDRTDCEEIRGTDYRSGTEREFFLANCINQASPTPTPEGTETPPLDGGNSTEEDEAGDSNGGSEP